MKKLMAVLGIFFLVCIYSLAPAATAGPVINGAVDVVCTTGQVPARIQQLAREGGDVDDGMNIVGRPLVAVARAGNAVFSAIFGVKGDAGAEFLETCEDGV